MSVEDAVVHVILISGARDGIEGFEKYGIVGTSVGKVNHEQRNSVGRGMITIPREGRYRVCITIT
jgi:hypothetical protein